MNTLEEVEDKNNITSSIPSPAVTLTEGLDLSPLVPVSPTLRILPTSSFINEAITRRNMILCTDIHAISNPFLKRFAYEEHIPQKFVPRLGAEISASRTVTNVSLNYLGNRLFVSFQRALFKVYNTDTLECQSDYEPPFEGSKNSFISKFYSNGLDRFFVVCRKTVVEYIENQTEYKYRYHTEGRVQSILTKTEPNIIIDKNGRFYSLSQLPQFTRRSERNGANRDIYLLNNSEARPGIGSVSRIIELETERSLQFYLVLVQFKHNIALLNIETSLMFNEYPNYRVHLWVERQGLSVDSRSAIQMRCAGSKYYYASIYKQNSVSDGKIYYNDLTSIGVDKPDEFMKTNNGSITRIDTFNELLVVITHSAHAEVYSLVSLHTLMDFKFGFPLSRAFILKGSIIGVCKCGHIISRQIPKDNYSLCYHCSEDFKEGTQWNICSHFLPKKPKRAKK